MPAFHLIRPKEDVLKEIRKQISKGRSIAEYKYDYDEVEDAIGRETKWDLLNTEILRRAFSDETILSEYKSIHLSKYYGDESDKLGTHENRVNKRVTFLEALIPRVKIIPEGGVSETAPSTASSERVFVIHGHDESSKSQVARFVEKLGLTAVILHEQPNKGKTIIEKLERHSDVAYAIALLTADDVGGSAGSTLKPRARENVIYELGRFQEKLGREKVCILHSPGVEIASDLRGIAYYELDRAGGWQLSVAKEMREAGLPVDLNRL